MQNKRLHKSHKASESTVRIISGKWRSIKISFTNVEGVRPTPDRVRETLFNWLAPYIINSKCLDLFSGSGVLGFEALSRGAAKVVMTDASPLVIKNIGKTALALKATNFVVMQGRIPDDLALIAKDVFDIVFIDPPYNKNLVQPTCDALEQSGLLAANTLLYIETENTLAIETVIPKTWTVLRSKITGQVKYNLVQRT